MQRCTQYGRLTLKQQASSESFRWFSREQASSHKCRAGCQAGRALLHNLLHSIGGCVRSRRSFFLFAFLKLIVFESKQSSSKLFHFWCARTNRSCRFVQISSIDALSPYYPEMFHSAFIMRSKRVSRIWSAYAERSRRDVNKILLQYSELFC